MRWCHYLMALVVVFMTGCLSAEDRDFFIKQGESAKARIAEYEKLLDETEETIKVLKAKIESKEIDVAAGLALINDAKEQYQGYKELIAEDRNRLERIDERLEGKSGAEKWEAAGWAVGSVIASILGIRLQRGPSSRGHKNPDGSIRLPG